MATKNNTATKPASAVEELAQAQWEDSCKSIRGCQQMSAQFFAIGEQLGWQGAASHLAKTGQQSADALAATFDERRNKIRDFIEDAKRTSAGAKR